MVTVNRKIFYLATAQHAMFYCNIKKYLWSKVNINHRSNIKNLTKCANCLLLHYIFFGTIRSRVYRKKVLLTRKRLHQRMYVSLRIRQIYIRFIDRKQTNLIKGGNVTFTNVEIWYRLRSGKANRNKTHFEWVKSTIYIIYFGILSQIISACSVSNQIQSNFHHATAFTIENSTKETSHPNLYSIDCSTIFSLF